MEARFLNGASVNRLYNNNSEGELLAAFQYSMDAAEYAKAKLAEDAKRDWFDSYYIVTDMFTGKAVAIRHNPEVKKAKAA